MKRKISKLDKIDLEFDPRPMTDEEKSALENYIAKEKRKGISKQKKNKYKSKKAEEFDSNIAAEPKAEYKKK